MTKAPARKKEPPIFGPKFKHVPKAGSQAGLVLKDEAVDHLLGRRWNEAVRVSLAAQALRPTDIDLHAVIAVAAAYSNKKTLCTEAVRAVRSITTDAKADDIDRANGLIAIASVRLAQGRFADADTEARKALAFDSEHKGAWWQLTAGFAGLGWFEQASECLPLATGEADVSSPIAPSKAAASQPAASQTATSQALTESSDRTQPLAEWQVGRAINQWAMSNTATWVVAVVGIFLFGILGLALAASTPFIAREIRVMRLDEPWRKIAQEAWRTEHKLRIQHALITLILVALWVLTLSIASGT